MDDPIQPRAVIAVGASAGGVSALQTLVSTFPPDLPAAVLAVLHIPASGPSSLPAILNRAGKVPARHAEDGALLREGEVLVAPPDRHLRVVDGKVEVSRGQKENGHRPSVDVLFRSVSEIYGAACAGVILSGFLDDGAAGLSLIHRRGGLAIVQSPADAAFPDMPRAAIRTGEVDTICASAKIYDCLTPWLDAVLTSPPPREEILEPDPNGAPPPPGLEITEFTCPDCGGTLWLDERTGVANLRCRVGHRHSFNSLMMGKQGAVEAAISAAIVALQERRDLCRRIQVRADGAMSPRRRHRYETEIQDIEGRLRLLEQVASDLADSRLTREELQDD
jgi:two-component system chemotaxis response regulator CheB